MKKNNIFLRGITLSLCLFSLTIYGQTFNGSGSSDDIERCPTTGSGSEFTINVSGVSAGFALSEVGVDITHTWNVDIDMTLISPAGTEIDLSSDNGGGSGSLGYDCSFRDDAATSITSASGPLVTGIYSPEEALANMGTETNGTWTLYICDDAGGDVGNLNSWSLTFIEPPCFAATGVTTSFIADNCGYVDVNITTVNDAVSITDGINSWAISGPGITQVGPFAEGETVNLSIIHDVSDCNFDLDEFDYSCPPANDSCANAIPLDCDTSVSGSTVAATNQDIGTCVTALGAGPGVWYTIMGTGDDITIDTEGSDFDTKLGVFEGSCNSLVCVDGDDDGGSGTLSELTFSSTEGVTYYIYVTGFLQNTGNYVLNVDCACKASMNECAIVYTSFGPAASTDLTVVAEYGVEPYTYDWSDGQSGQTITVAPTSTQVYSVLVTDAEGCTSTAVTNVLVSDIDITCPNNNNSVKVTLCHDGQEICVSENAVQAHLNHGDFLGSCNPDFDCSTAPLCDAALKVPEPEATNISTEIEIVWSAASGLVNGYYLSVGTTLGGTDILNAVDVGNTLEYDLSGLLDFETTYHVNVVAYNNNGVPTNCQASDYFTTEESPCNQAQFTECGQTYSGSTVGLPVQNGLSCDISLDTSGGAWYLFIGNGDEITMDTNGSNFDTRLGVFSGTCDALVCVAGDDDDGDSTQSLLTFISAPGTPYFVYVTGYSSNEGDYVLNITCVPPPTCDDGIQNGNETGVDCGGPDCEECPPLPGQNCDNAEVVACGDTISASTVGYPVHPELSSCSTILDNAGGRFYKFVGTGDNVTIDTNGSGIDTVLGLFSGSCNALTCVDSDDDGGSGTRSLINFVSVLGTDYYIYVSGFSGTGSINLNVTCVPPPPECNDNEVTVVINTDSFSDTDPNTWVIRNDSDNSIVAEGNNLPESSTITDILCLPDGCYTFTINDGWGDGIFQDPAYVISDSNGVLVSGSGYDFDYSVSESFCIPPPPPAPGEACSTATALVCGVTTSATTVGTTGSDTVTGGCSMSAYGKWFTFVGSGSSTTVTTVAASGYDHEMSISRGTCGSLVNVTCRDIGGSGGTETYTFTSIAGTTYYVYVAQWLSSSTATGNFTINVTSCQTAIMPNPTNTEVSWSMYPNPATRGEVQLDLTNYLNQDVNIQMMDYSGKTLMNKAEPNLQNPKYRVNTQNMPSGMYFVRVVTESGTSIKKLIIAN
ncbi:T9SS type A sorting domain-containing protein [Formosa maritima]|uniref:T9SS type A sorting domain-containing protein n=1 Tax=Formosa maritima TaxID=2592046 RepID=A0A5D0GLH2_9FLAO|nr:T9SS type A sorting domain-containing protein [Formosa maritima]TYA59706.1 T9SS type A sorting domain-containing protein [Formosa maritima]